MFYNEAYKIDINVTNLDVEKLFLSENSSWYSILAIGSCMATRQLCLFPLGFKATLVSTQQRQSISSSAMWTTTSSPWLSPGVLPQAGTTPGDSCSKAGSSSMGSSCREAGEVNCSSPLVSSCSLPSAWSSSAQLMQLGWWCLKE